jgi:hypothetical protein
MEVQSRLTAGEQRGKTLNNKEENRSGKETEDESNRFSGERVWRGDEYGKRQRRDEKRQR